MLIDHDLLNDDDLVNPIRIMSWNIQCLNDDVLLDSYFKQLVHSNDIIILTETWLQDQIQVFTDNYYNYHHIRHMHASARRPSGGISILISHKLRGNGKAKRIQIVKEMK